jgi:hypothetical protein
METFIPLSLSIRALTLTLPYNITKKNRNRYIYFNYKKTNAFLKKYGILFKSVNVNAIKKKYTML